MVNSDTKGKGEGLRSSGRENGGESSRYSGGESALGSLEQAQGIIRRAASEGVSITLAESCTAGLAANLLASIPGASQVLWGAFICYTLNAKAAMLGIDPLALDRWGAVSQETAVAMAQGALERSGADIAVSVTGLTSPEGDGSSVPLGTVWIGAARQGAADAWLSQYRGDRNTIRRLAAEECLEVLARELDIFLRNKYIRR